MPAGTGWVNKVEKFKNRSTTISEKFDIYGLLYQNIPLKDVTKVDILNIMYSDPTTNSKFL